MDNSKKYPEFGEKLRQLRVAKSKTQEEVSVELSVGLKSYQSWEEGRAFPRPLALVTLANYFSISPSEFYSTKGTGEENSDQSDNTTSEEEVQYGAAENEKSYIQIIAKCAQALADTAIAAKESALAAKEAALATKDSVNATNRVLDMMPTSLTRPADQIDRVSEELRVERLGVMALTRMTLERFARQEGKTYDDLYEKEFCSIVAELEGTEKQGGSLSYVGGSPYR